jgi:UDP-glucose 4-epimerase
MTTVSVTGSSGYLGQKAVHELAQSDAVGRIIGIDLRPPSSGSHKLEHYEMDVRSPQVSEVITGADVLVHLALTEDGTPDEIKDNNVGGTRAIAEAAVRAGVSKVVLGSTFRVYGHHADNDFPLTEGSPVRPLSEDVFAQSMVEAEGAVRFLGGSHPEVCVTVLRLANIIGRDLPTWRAASLDSPVRPAIDTYDPPLQFLGESDGGRGVAHAVDRDLPGVYNVSSDDWIDAGESVLRQRALRIGSDQAPRLMSKLERLGVPVPAGGAAALMYPAVLSGAAFRATGFAPIQSSSLALEEAQTARREWTAIGPVRFRPRRVAVAAATLVALAMGSRIRRSRRRKKSRT